MKTLFSLVLGLLALAPAHAQLFGPRAANGALLGGIAGGIIGHNSGGNWRHDGWRGAAWGAGAGWLLGSIIDANYGYGYHGYDGYGSYGYGYPRTVVTAQPQPVAVQSAPAAAPAPQQVT